MAKSTRSRKAIKPSKPYPDFPLTPHPSGRWCKRINGKLRFFGRWGHVKAGKLVRVDDVGASATEALDRFKAQRDDLYANREPEPAPAAANGPILADIINGYLTDKKILVDVGKLTGRSFDEYRRTCGLVIKTFGRSRSIETLTSDDFRQLYRVLSDRYGLVRLGNEIQRVKMIFKWGQDEGKIQRTIPFGQLFRKPSKDDIKKQRDKREHGQTFTAEELRRVLDALAGKPVAVEGQDEPVTLTPNPTLRAMVLLGINAAYGQSDCARLLSRTIDLEGGWAKSSRPKTGADRGAKLWPETVAAIREALAVRPGPRDPADKGLLFLTSKGKRWVRESVTYERGAFPSDPKDWTDEHRQKMAKLSFRTDLIGNAFGKVLKSLGINGRRGFYNLRHTAASIADQTGDRIAVQYLMGHKDQTMTGNYVHSAPFCARMEIIATYIRTWLFGETAA